MESDQFWYLRLLSVDLNSDELESQSRQYQVLPVSHYRVSAAQHSNLSNAWLPVALFLEDQFEISPRDGEGALESVKSHLSLVSPDFFLETCSLGERNSCPLS